MPQYMRKWKCTPNSSFGLEEYGIDSLGKVCFSNLTRNKVLCAERHQLLLMQVNG